MPRDESLDFAGDGVLPRGTERREGGSESHYNTIVVARELGERGALKDLGERALRLASDADQLIAFLVNEIAGSLAAG